MPTTRPSAGQVLPETHGWLTTAGEFDDSMPIPSGEPASPLGHDDVPVAVANANVPTLLATLVHLTGSRAWLDDRFRPERPRGIAEADGGGLAPEIQEEIRDAAIAAIRDWLGGKPAAISEFTPREALEILEFTVGESVPEDYADYIVAGLTTDLTPRREARRIERTEELRGLTVAVIGAGVSGIGAAIAMKRRGAEVTVFERTPDIGGTWNLNRYPGCGVDTASHLYSFSEEPADWGYYYAPQQHLKAYVKQVAELNDVANLIRFGTEVTSAIYDEDVSMWRLTLADNQGVREVTADVVFSAVGAFGKPSAPRVQGLDDFAGSVYHTADWPADAQLEGKRVGVIGTGASAMQLVPSIVDSVEHMAVYQRSPQWAAPFEQFRKPIEQPVRSLLRSVPMYRAWNRARLGWLLNDKVHESLQIDPNWDDEGRSVNAANAGHRRFFTRYMENQLGGDQELLAKTLPSYPPFGKRMLLDNGWFRALRRDHVDLVVDPIVRIEPNGVRTADGNLLEIDTLILATGFDVVHYLSGVQVEGVDGRPLAQEWDEDNGRAYLGLTVPGFPNLFCLYGPNAAPGHGGSYFSAAECQLDYAVDLLSKMRETGAAAVDVRRTVYEEYNAQVDEAHSKMIWTHEGFNTYYRNKRGRVVYANPFRILDFWKMTREADLADYDLRKPVS